MLQAEESQTPRFSGHRRDPNYNPKVSEYQYSSYFKDIRAPEVHTIPLLGPFGNNVHLNLKANCSRWSMGGAGVMPQKMTSATPAMAHVSSKDTTFLGSRERTFSKQITPANTEIYNTEARKPI